MTDWLHPGHPDYPYEEVMTDTTGTPLTPEEEALYRDGLRDAYNPSVPAWNLSETSRREWVDRCRRLLATLDREHRERVDPDLRARIERLRSVASGGVLTSRDERYDLGWDDAIKEVAAILAATEAPRFETFDAADGHKGIRRACIADESSCFDPDCPKHSEDAATPDHTEGGEEREAQIAAIAAALHEGQVGCEPFSKPGDHAYAAGWSGGHPFSMHNSEAAGLYDAGLRATPRPR